jgi:RHS repeat-associated protein
MRKLCYYSTAVVVNVATGITYAPLSNLLTAMTHGNGLITTAGYDLDYRLSSLTLKDGATNVSALAYAYTDGMNLTGITDGVTAANSNTLGYSLANRLNAATGPWGSKSFGYDGVGNRITDNTTLSGVTTNRTQYYGSTNNRLGSIYEGATQLRSYTYDNAGNILTDTRAGDSIAYTYNKRNRLSAVTRTAGSVATSSYGYNALEQLTTRTTTAAGGPVGQVAYTYDRDGHLITEATAGTGVKTREYIWLPSNDNSPVDLPLAVIDVASNTISYVHADHLGHPIRMTSPTKATVWQATWKPWGEVQTLSGSNTNNLRFPGQYFQIETGLHYNHHRMYDPVTGRYTQPDPLRFVDGPSVYAYAKNSPYMNVDREGLEGEPQGWPSEYPKLPLSDDNMRPMTEDQLKDMEGRLSRGKNNTEAKKVQKWRKEQDQKNKGKQRGGPKLRVPGLPFWFDFIPAPNCENYPGAQELGCAPILEANYCPMPVNLSPQSLLGSLK